jgi:hypothetical protein
VGVGEFLLPLKHGIGTYVVLQPIVRRPVQRRQSVDLIPETRCLDVQAQTPHRATLAVKRHVDEVLLHCHMHGKLGPLPLAK